MSMKKLLTTILSVLFVISAAACGELTCEHDYVWRSYKETHKCKCVKCGEIEEGSEELHELVELEGKTPTYTKDGNKAGLICSVCETITEGGETLLARTPFKSKTFIGLNYCEYKPSLRKGQKVPLILYLHGAGERGSNNESQLKHTITEVVKWEGDSPFMDAVVLAPQCPSGISWTGVDHSGGMYLLDKETEILKSVMSLVQEYSTYDYVDTDRIYVIGVSMGGYATWELAARYPDTFAAAVPICGSGPIDQVSVLKDVPIYAFHGKLDPLVPYSGSEYMVNAILSAGGEKVVFKTYEDGYHDIWNKAITFEGDEQIPALAEWLFSQSK